MAHFLKKEYLFPAGFYQTKPTSDWANLDRSTLWESAQTLSLGTANDGTSLPPRLPTDRSRLRPPPPWLDPSCPWPGNNRADVVYRKRHLVIEKNSYFRQSNFVLFSNSSIFTNLFPKLFLQKNFSFQFFYIFSLPLFSCNLNFCNCFQTFQIVKNVKNRVEVFIPKSLRRFFVLCFAKKAIEQSSLNLSLGWLHLAYPYNGFT